ncbi:hypothetical protein [Microbulbifer halophilus]|uniref:Lipoprotein n=1 Tax=Microbulbifer halophilus TaxID=453963 RepID=A0ABW5EAW1_9GAMM|nr:hypothetical protein [Microbulbifer halophilus]MCW8125908.1 hypothetical protein [Microbulbifer halophilus]
MVKQILFFTLSLLTVQFLPGCTKANTDITVTEITGRGVDDDSGAFCSDFSLTTEEAQHYFDKTRKVSVKELHDRYDFLPCYVKGKATRGGQICEWEIRAGGTGRFTCGEDAGLTACVDCLPAAKTSH